jgi:hypothetical protein
MRQSERAFAVHDRGEFLRGQTAPNRDARHGERVGARMPPRDAAGAEDAIAELLQHGPQVGRLPAARQRRAPDRQAKARLEDALRLAELALEAARSSAFTNGCVREWLPTSIPAATISRSCAHVTYPGVSTSVGTTKNVARSPISVRIGNVTS